MSCCLRIIPFVFIFGNTHTCMSYSLMFIFKQFCYLYDPLSSSNFTGVWWISRLIYLHFLSFFTMFLSSSLGCVELNTFLPNHGAPMIFHCSRTIKDYLNPKNFREIKTHAAPRGQSSGVWR